MSDIYLPKEQIEARYKEFIELNKDNPEAMNAIKHNPLIFAVDIADVASEKVIKWIKDYKGSNLVIHLIEDIEKEIEYQGIKREE